jgi:arginine N-succinyltransferase
MNFIVRGIKESDLNSAMMLARQFSLLNLPYDRPVVEQLIEKSEASFRGEVDKEDARYIFVIEDVENKHVAGSSQVLAKHGSIQEPSYSFEVLKKERFSRDLGVGFIHQILRLKINEDGPTEIGGLVVDRAYRSRPEKIGKVISLIRFVYMGLAPERFENYVYAQMAPPLTDDGRSEFWESLGRRFTGMPYQEADLLSQKNREFIRSLFPEEDIYLCLLDSKARLVMGRVSNETQPALHLLESIGMNYINEVDPFDGGPHLGAKVKEISLIKNGKTKTLSPLKEAQFNEMAFIGIVRENQFLGGFSAIQSAGEEIILPEKTCKILELSAGEKVFVSQHKIQRAKGSKNVKS